MNRETEILADELLRIARLLVAKRPRYGLFLDHVSIIGVDPEDDDAVDAALLKLYKQLGKHRRELERVGYRVRSVVDARPVKTMHGVVVPVKFSGVYAEAEPVMKKVLDEIS